MEEEKWKLKEEVVFDPEKGTLTWHNQRMIVLSAYELPSIHIEALKIIGPVANTEVYETCAHATKLFFEGQIKELPKTSPTELIKKFLEEMIEWGIGKIEVVEFDVEKGGVIRVHDGCYYSYYKDAKEPVCYITAGMLKGMISAVIEKEVEVKEKSCMATGSPYCEFEVKIG